MVVKQRGCSGVLYLERVRVLQGLRSNHGKSPDRSEFRREHNARVGVAHEITRTADTYREFSYASGTWHRKVSNGIDTHYVYVIFKTYPISSYILCISQVGL
jgi:hypothetical protein